MQILFFGICRLVQLHKYMSVAWNKGGVLPASISAANSTLVAFFHAKTSWNLLLDTCCVNALCGRGRLCLQHEIWALKGRKVRQHSHFLCLTFEWSLNWNKLNSAVYVAIYSSADGFTQWDQRETRHRKVWWSTVKHLRSRQVRACEIAGCGLLELSSCLDWPCKCRITKPNTLPPSVRGGQVYAQSKTVHAKIVRSGLFSYIDWKIPSCWVAFAHNYSTTNDLSNQLSNPFCDLNTYNLRRTIQRNQIAISIKIKQL